MLGLRNQDDENQHGPEGNGNIISSSSSEIDIVVERPTEKKPDFPKVEAETRRNAGRIMTVAASKGDWDTAKDLISKNPNIHRTLLAHGDTALHIATSAKHTAFVENLLQLPEFTLQDLAIHNRSGDTALCIAASSQVIEIAQAMVDKKLKLSESPLKPELPLIRGSQGRTPLHIAALLGHKDMVRYLYKATDFRKLTYVERINIFVALINIGVYDLPLELLAKYPRLAVARDSSCGSALGALAKKCSDINGDAGNSLTIMGTSRSINSGLKGLMNKQPTMAQPTLAYKLFAEIWDLVLQLEDDEISELIDGSIFTAAEFGNVEFLVNIICSYPAAIQKVDRQGRSIFNIAVLHRREQVFNLIHNIGAFKDRIVTTKDSHGNNILHMAGKLPPRDRFGSSGANLQIQRELLWFQEVEKIVPAAYKNSRNGEWKTPRQVFEEEHDNLLKSGGTAMKETANSCVLVATLVATVAFAAALTVPGASNNDTVVVTATNRSAILNKDWWFKIFVVSNAVALFTSSTSIIFLLSTLTSGFTQDDFITSLQRRLMFGITTLFVSITSMVIAFTAASFLIFDYKSAWIPYLITALACVPVVMFLLLHHKLWEDLMRSTLIRSANWYVFRPSKYKIF